MIGAHQARQRRDGIFVPFRLGRSGGRTGDLREPNPNGVGKYLANLLGLPSDLLGERRQRATVAGFVEMVATEIILDPLAERVVGELRIRRQATVLPQNARFEHFREQRILVVEMRVEPAGRQLGGLHHGIDARALVSFFAKQAARFGNDPLVGFLLVIAGVSHRDAACYLEGNCTILENSPAGRMPDEA